MEWKLTEGESTPKIKEVDKRKKCSYTPISFMWKKHLRTHSCLSIGWQRLSTILCARNIIESCLWEITQGSPWYQRPFLNVWAYLFLQVNVWKTIYLNCVRRGGLMVSLLVFGASGPGSSPGWGHCIVFLGKTLNSHSASLHPGV